MLKQVVEGLAALHARGIVHRDLKPGNLLVGQDGHVKVADFGLAKQVGGEQSTVLTRTGTFAGTMHYMAPEQAEGMDITPATDVYALGVIWHFVAVGTALAMAFAAVVDENLMSLGSQLGLSRLERFSR